MIVQTFERIFERVMQAMIHDFRNGYGTMATVWDDGRVEFPNGQVYQFTRYESVPKEYVSGNIPRMGGYEFVYWLKRTITWSGKELIISVFRKTVNTQLDDIAKN